MCFVPNSLYNTFCPNALIPRDNALMLRMKDVPEIIEILHIVATSELPEHVTVRELGITLRQLFIVSSAGG